MWYAYHSFLHKDKEKTRIVEHDRFARSTNSLRFQIITTIVASQISQCTPSTSTHIERKNNTVFLFRAMVKIQTSNVRFQLPLVVQGPQSFFIAKKAA